MAIYRFITNDVKLYLPEVNIDICYYDDDQEMIFRICFFFNSSHTFKGLNELVH